MPKRNPKTSTAKNASAKGQTANPVIAAARFVSENDGTAIQQVETWRKPVYSSQLGRPMYFTRKCITLRQ